MLLSSIYISDQFWRNASLFDAVSLFYQWRRKFDNEKGSNNRSSQKLLKNDFQLIVDYVQEDEEFVIVDWVMLDYRVW